MLLVLSDHYPHLKCMFWRGVFIWWSCPTDFALRSPFESTYSPVTPNAFVENVRKTRLNRTQIYQICYAFFKSGKILSIIFHMDSSAEISIRAWSRLDNASRLMFAAFIVLGYSSGFKS